MNINTPRNKLSLALALSLGINQGVYAQFTSPLQLSDINGLNGFVIQGVNSGDSSGKAVSSAGDINGDGIDDLIIGAPNASVSTGSSSALINPLNLSSLNGANGFKIQGVNTGDQSGVSVSSAGDVNGDNIDDLIVGARTADSNGVDSGSSYVVFGKTLGLTNPLNLSALNGTNGFAIYGAHVGDYSGKSVSSAGDINGDGIDDLIIGAPYADIIGGSSGSSHVVFGSTSVMVNPLNLSNLNGTNGFSIYGSNSSEYSGRSVSSAGDLNGDGINDLIIGAQYANSNGSNSGSSYVVFGSISGFVNPLNLSSLNGTNGFAIFGANAGDNSGTSVSSAGDINGDGIDDLIIGARYAANSGSSYVVFGNSSGFVNPLILSSLNGTNGFVIQGVNTGDKFGSSVSSAGDINGDGITDLIIGAPYADPNGSNSGSSYVVFGSSSGFASPLNLSALNGTNGFAIQGVSAGNNSGSSVSSAGDINGDGVADLIIGAYRTAGGVGKSYVVFGRSVNIFTNGFE